MMMTLLTMTYEEREAPKFAAIAAGGEHTLLLSENGSVFSMGRCDNGRLGLKQAQVNDKLSTADSPTKDDHDVQIPCELPLPCAALRVAAGEYHSALVLCDYPERLLTFGCGAVGQLGHVGPTDDVFEPREVEYFSNATKGCAVTSLALGDGHSLAALDDGSVHAFGNNESGALGLPGTAASSGFSKQSERYGFAVRGASRALPAAVVPLVQQQQSIIKVATGTRHSAFITSQGALFVAGENQFGQLGMGGLTRSTIPRRVNQTAASASPFDGEAIVDVGCGARHTVAVTSSGAVWASGSNESGELGLGSIKSTTQFTRVHGFDPDDVVVAVSCGAAHTLMLTAKGCVYGCGWSECGALGLGEAASKSNVHHVTRVYPPSSPASSVLTPPASSEADQHHPRAIAMSCSSHHSLILLVDGVVVGCGSNGHGQLGAVVSPRRSRGDATPSKVFDWVAITKVMFLPESKRRWIVDEASQRRQRAAEADSVVAAARAATERATTASNSTVPSRAVVKSSSDEKRDPENDGGASRDIAVRSPSPQGTPRPVVTVTPAESAAVTAAALGAIHEFSPRCTSLSPLVKEAEKDASE